jgi:hypothetical protein
MPTPGIEPAHAWPKMLLEHPHVEMLLVLELAGELPQIAATGSPFFAHKHALGSSSTTVARRNPMLGLPLCR